MVTLSASDLAQMQGHLHNAIVSCTDRCLYHSAKWAAEILNSFESPADPNVELLPQQQQSQNPRETHLEARERAKYLLAKTYFDCKEYDRCAAVFLPGTLPKGPIPTQGKGKSRASAAAEAKAVEQLRPLVEEVVPNLSQKALFLALYSKYISGEKRRDEDSEMILGPVDGGITVNRELNGIARILEHWFAERDARNEEGQGWLEYLYGIVLAKSKNEELAKKWLVRSVHQYPYNWGAWEELSGLIGSVEELTQITERLPENIMTIVFYIFSSQELYQATDQVHNQLSQVQGIFPNSSFLKTQRALLFYHSKDFEEAESIFSGLLHTDPYRIDSIDNYSNILYVMEHRPKLAFLAQLATSTDKFRPETCCAVGNYYSLKSEHEKAVMYFRRALTLDRNFLSAWTLMGHEYVEMKNTHAAIESYRRAVDVNRKDYRAWYGLGQTYEVLEMHSYALFYYQRAASLRPYDPKMWQAVGSCFGRVGKHQNGIRAFKRALVAASYYDGGGGGGGAGSSFGSQDQHRLGGGLLDPETLYQIALLYERLNDRDECAAYMELTLAQEEGPDGDDDFAASHGSGGGAVPAERTGGVGVTPTTSKARMWLARWEFVRGGYQRSMELANELCQDGVEVEEAKALVRDIRARIERERDDAASTVVGDVEGKYDDDDDDDDEE